MLSQTVGACPSAAHSLLGIDDPRRAEPIGRHAEALRPERLLKRHLHRAVLSKRIEHLCALGSVLEVQSDAESGGPAEWSDSVCPLQYLIADVQRHVHDASVCFRRHALRHRRLANRLDERDLSAQGLLVELECLAALAVEGKIGIQLLRGILAGGPAFAAEGRYGEVSPKLASDG